MKMPKISLKYLVFLIVSYLLSFLYIGNSTLSFTTLPSIIYTLTNSNLLGSIMIILIFLMTGVYKGAPQIIAARVLVALSFGIGVYIFGKINKNSENLNLASVSITVIPSVLVFFIIRYFYDYEAAMSMSRTVIITLAINTILAIIIQKVVDMPDQKGVLAKWLKN